MRMAFAAHPLRFNSRVHRGLRGDLWNLRERLKQQRFHEQENRRQKLPVTKLNFFWDALTTFLYTQIYGHTRNQTEAASKFLRPSTSKNQKMRNCKNLHTLPAESQPTVQEIFVTFVPFPKLNNFMAAQRP